MTITYIVVEEKEEYAIIEFIDSETKLSQQRQINIYGLNESEKQERYSSHEHTFTHRLSLNMIKEPEEAKETISSP